MTRKKQINFVKSSFSGPKSHCVGVGNDNDAVYVTNVSCDAPIVEFTKEEWRAFVLGVKAGEFDKFGDS